MDFLDQRKKFKNKHPVWSDPDDEKRATKEPPPRETVVDLEYDSHCEDGSDSSDDDYVLTSGEVRSKQISLESKELRFKHLININNDRSYSGSVNQVQFHPKSKIAMTTLSKGQVDLFEVDGERNKYIQNIKLPFAVKPFCAFKPDGESIVITSENYRGDIYVHDMISATTKSYPIRIGKEAKEISDFQIHGDYIACRKEGSPEILMLSSSTYEKVFSLKLNEPAKAIQFTNNNQIFIAGENARIYLWDLRKTSLCKNRFQDEGSVHATSLALSELSQLLSVGTDCGIVNSYKLSKCLNEKNPVPVKTFMNLKTPINILRYNHSGQLLLMGSSQEPEAFRMVHTHSNLVYRNFPVAQKQYGRLLSADFSPLSGYLALGTSRGRAHLCRIPYYQAY